MAMRMGMPMDTRTDMRTDTRMGNRMGKRMATHTSMGMPRMGALDRITHDYDNDVGARDHELEGL